MKTPITYYGGKQRMCSIIVPLIPEHKIYVEPFAGGAAVFFAKKPSEIEVLNDTNKEIINFYYVLKNKFSELQKEVQSTLHSRELHRRASVIYNNPDMFDDVKRAWALWVLSKQSFSSIIDAHWTFDRARNSKVEKINSSIENFKEYLSLRLKNCTLECADALYVIKSRDTEHAFFYCDPPYYNANMGHYGGYTINDYKRLLTVLSNIKGKFLLSSYPNPVLTEYTKKHKWSELTFDMPVAACSNVKSKRKIEVLVANYDLKKNTAHQNVLEFDI